MTLTNLSDKEIGDLNAILKIPFGFAIKDQTKTMVKISGKSSKEIVWTLPKDLPIASFVTLDIKTESAGSVRIQQQLNKDR